MEAPFVFEVDLACWDEYVLLVTTSWVQSQEELRIVQGPLYCIVCFLLVIDRSFRHDKLKLRIFLSEVSVIFALDLVCFLTSKDRNFQVTEIFAREAALNLHLTFFRRTQVLCVFSDSRSREFVIKRQALRAKNVTRLKFDICLHSLTIDAAPIDLRCLNRAHLRAYLLHSESETYLLQVDLVILTLILHWEILNRVHTSNELHCPKAKQDQKHHHNCQCNDPAARRRVTITALVGETDLSTE